MSEGLLTAAIFLFAVGVSWLLLRRHQDFVVVEITDDTIKTQAGHRISWTKINKLQLIGSTFFLLRDDGPRLALPDDNPAALQRCLDLIEQRLSQRAAAPSLPKL